MSLKSLLTVLFLTISNGAYSMDESKFWSMIEQASAKSRFNSDDTARILERELSKMPKQDIFDFELIMRQKIFEADHFNVMIAQKIIDGYVSDDSYLYFRCWLVSLGKDAFYGVIEDTDYLAKLVNKNTVPDFESLLYVATSAYSINTGKEEDETFPRDTMIDKGLDYDGLDLQTKGEDWTEEDLPNRAPKLWSIFRG